MPAGIYFTSKYANSNFQSAMQPVGQRQRPGRRGKHVNYFFFLGVGLGLSGPFPVPFSP